MKANYIALVFTFFILACRPLTIPGGGGGQPATTGSIFAQASYSSIQDGLACSGGATIQFTPVNITGAEGTRAALTQSVIFQGVSGSNNKIPPTYFCSSSAALAANLAFGTWTITASTGPWTASCNRTVCSGGLCGLAKTPNFVVGLPGCEG